MAKAQVGKITHFFDKISVAVIELTAELKKGDMISIEGPQTNIAQPVASMQIEKKEILVAKKGQSIGMKVNGPVKVNDVVYKVTP